MVLHRKQRNIYEEVREKSKILFGTNGPLEMLFTPNGIIWHCSHSLSYHMSTIIINVYLPHIVFWLSHTRLYSKQNMVLYHSARNNHHYLML